MTIQTQIPALPSQVKVGMYDYSVEHVNNLTADDGMGLWGEAKYMAQTIRLDTALAANPTRQLNVFVHELLHAVLHEAGLDEYFNDENLVRPLSNQLAQVFVDNGWTFGVSHNVTTFEGVAEMAKRIAGYEPVVSGDVLRDLPSFAKTNAAAGEIHVHEGVEYRTVERQAKVGEFVLVLSTGYLEADEPRAGGVYVCESQWRGEIVGGTSIFVKGGFLLDTLHRDVYVVLEPLAKGGADHGTI